MTDDVTIMTAPTGGAKPDVYVIRDGKMVRQEEVEPLEKPKPDRAYILKAQKTDWETPHWLFDELWDEFDGFDLDPTCQAEDYTANRILKAGGMICIPTDAEYDKNEWWSQIYRDGLVLPWQGKVWLNPPYGDEEVDWIAKAYNETQSGNADTVVALLPVRTDTKRWHKYIHGKAEIRFLKGRLRFVGAPASAPFPSCIVIWQKPPIFVNAPGRFTQREFGGMSVER